MYALRLRRLCFDDEIVVTHQSTSRKCGEMKCGTISNVMVDDETSASQYVTVGRSNIKNAGNGLFARNTIPRGTCIGYFGGIRECSMCVKQHRKLLGKYSYDSIEGDIEYGEWEDVLWHLTRSNDEVVNGLMWLINSSHPRNRFLKFQFPNVVFYGGGLASDGHPSIAVITMHEIHSGDELLASYMKSIPSFNA